MTKEVELEKPKKVEEPIKNKDFFCAFDFISALEEADVLTKDSEVSKLAAKIKELKKEGDTWTDVAKKAIELAKKKKPPVPPEKPVPEKEEKSELNEETIRKIIQEEMKKTPAKKLEEPEKEEPEKSEKESEKELALKKQVEELSEKVDRLKNRGFKVCRQPEELKENKGTTYLIEKGTGAITVPLNDYCKW